MHNTQIVGLNNINIDPLFKTVCTIKSTDGMQNLRQDEIIETGRSGVSRNSFEGAKLEPPKNKGNSLCQKIDLQKISYSADRLGLLKQFCFIGVWFDKTNGVGTYL